MWGINLSQENDKKKLNEQQNHVEKGKEQNNIDIANSTHKNKVKGKAGSNHSMVVKTKSGENKKKRDMNKKVVRTTENPAEYKEQTTSIAAQNEQMAWSKVKNAKKKKEIENHIKETNEFTQKAKWVQTEMLKILHMKMRQDLILKRKKLSSDPEKIRELDKSMKV